MRFSRRDFIAVTTVAVSAATRLNAQNRRAKKAKGPVPPERVQYQIHPAVGVARLGNSPDAFYLEPQTIGGLPIECDSGGNPVMRDGQPVYVRKFKDDRGAIKRQGAQFAIYACDSADPGDPGREISLDDPMIESVEWTVHLANKKGVWYENDELIGDVMLAHPGYPNYYEKDSFHNWDVSKPDTRDPRSRWIIDPGPRTVSRPGEKVSFSRDNIPPDYTKGGFPKIDKDNPRAPYEINTLGNLLMDRNGRLVVLGGHGFAGGTEAIVTYTGQDTWFDDISDGPVTCRLKLKGRSEPIVLTAWALVGSPKYAPELRNISTLDDVMFDVGVRYKNLVPEMFSGGAFNPSYHASYERDIQPIFDRIADYIWVANVPSMVAFSAPRFNPRDSSEGNRANRETFYRYFRDSSGNEVSPPHNVLFYNNVPLMPLNSGSNSVTSDNIDRFMGLTNTQYFLLGQWAKGLFTSGDFAPLPVHPRDAASVGNCVGHPMSPGIEVTWTTRNPLIYEAAYRIKHSQNEDYYREHGLSADGDETGSWYRDHGLETPKHCVVQEGCEPGDLTKRMSSPWMSDFYQCAIEYVSFKGTTNELSLSGIPPAPTYYANWWPPQAPVNVITGGMTRHDQEAAGLPAGFSVYYARGANNIANLVIAWKYMGFVVNENTSQEGNLYPYFTEAERNHERFVVSSVAVGSPVNQLSASGSYNTPSNFFSQTWYLREEQAIAECNGIPDCDQKP
ncbi:MAG TPA: CTQ-dependent lysine 6-oxidase LodA [Thermoanaerobaculia bacterium]|jgi:L-lysine 6-oxidase